MTVALTSLKTYHEIKDDGTLSKMQQRVHDLLETTPDGLTNKEIANQLSLDINCVTPRVNELVKKGRVLKAGCRTCPHSKRSAKVWILQTNPALFQNQEQDNQKNQQLTQLSFPLEVYHA